MESIKNALVLRLTNIEAIQEELLKTEIRIDHETCALEIRTVDELRLRYLVQTIEEYAPSAYRLGYQGINFYLKGNLKYECPTHLFLQEASIPMQSENGQSPGGIPIMEPAQIRNWVNTNPSLRVVRMSDGIGIMAGANVQQSSGIPLQEWEGREMDQEISANTRTWPPEELSRFMAALFTQAKLKDFTYEAYLYTGQRCRFRVNAWLIFCEELGGLLRIVEVLEVTPV